MLDSRPDLANANRNHATIFFRPLGHGERAVLVRTQLSYHYERSYATSESVGWPPRCVPHPASCVSLRVALSGVDQMTNRAGWSVPGTEMSDYEKGERR